MWPHICMYTVRFTKTKKKQNITDLAFFILKSSGLIWNCSKNVINK